MAFEDILGNQRTVKILRKLLKRGRVPNSMLFRGPEGVGKNDAALVFAKALNCLDSNDNACEKCANCRAVNRGAFPDVMTITPEKDVIKIEQMRLLKQTAYLKPMVGKKRVFIIQQAEKMKEEAANSLLKVLEEPPDFSHIVLITHNDHLILSTILSRCQVLTFSPISREDVTARLLEKGYALEQANIIAMLVDGNVRLALEMDWESVQARRALAWDMMLVCLRMEGTASLMHELSSAGSDFRKDLDKILEIQASFVRDVILLKSGGLQSLLINPDYRENLLILRDHMSLEQCHKLLRTIEYALYAQQRRVNAALLVNLLFSRYMESNHV
jgi:DNA polymerase-3 subunit delta'